MTERLYPQGKTYITEQQNLLTAADLLIATEDKMLNHFLFDSKFSLNKKETVCFVMGNEAADLDSMASSVVYAYYLQSLNSDDKSIYIPLINIPKEDFKLRTEAVYLFTDAGIETENLIFTDEINMEEISKSVKLSIILVDHNRISARYSSYAERVIEVIDHHKDEGVYSSGMTTIEPVGSCATLVSEKIFENSISLIDEKTAQLMAGTILLDTVNFNPDAKRTTDKDVKITEYLLKEFSLDREKLFEKLQFEKFNTSSLSTTDLLRKDYKEWKMGGKNCGFSSALLPVSKWLEKDKSISLNISDYCKNKNLEILFIMIAYTEPEFTRELILYSEDAGLRKSIVNCMNDNDLQLEQITGIVNPDSSKMDIFAQKNAAYSRKKLQPVIQDFLDS